MKLVPAFVAGLALAWGLASCGSGGSGTLAKQVKSAAATAQVTGATPTVATTDQATTPATATESETTRTTPAKTVTAAPKTVTTPAETVTTTQTVTQGGHSAAKVAVVTPDATTDNEQSD